MRCPGLPKFWLPPCGFRAMSRGAARRLSPSRRPWSLRPRARALFSFTLSCLKQVFRRSVLFCSPWKFGSSAGNGGMIGNTGRECRMPKRVMGNLALRPYSIRGYGIHRGLSVPVQLRHIQGDSGTTRRPLSALSRSRPCTGRKLHRLSMGGNLVTAPPRKKTK